ncbi:MAG: Hsp20 family protein [Propionivibrio sp.]
MANLSRYRGYGEGLDDLFRGFLMSPVRLDGQPELQIKIDVSEDEKAYTVHAEIPGVNKEDILVGVDGNQVSISAEIKNVSEVKEGSRVLRSERYFGSVSRAFSLAQDVDASTVSAKYANGVLELVLPKRTVARSTRIRIE